MKLSRKDIISHFSKFLSIVWYKAISNKNAVHQNPNKYLDGIDFNMFKNGVP